MRIAAAVLCLFLAGCTHARSEQGIRWYNPGTWFSGSAGRQSAKVEQKLDTAREKAIVEAQKAVHEAGDALALASDSRPVSVAKEATQNAETLLDQVAGPLDAKDAAAIRERVRLLVSELADERAKGEVLRKESNSQLLAVSSKLTELEQAKKLADADLAKAFERENGLANELRNERWWSWFWRISIGVLALVFAAAFIYVRLTLGGLPTALGRSLAELRSRAPGLADQLTNTLDVHLSPAEQNLIAALALRHR